MKKITAKALRRKDFAIIGVRQKARVYNMYLGILTSPPASGDTTSSITMYNLEHNYVRPQA